MLKVFFSFCQLGWTILVRNRKATNALYNELNALLKPHGFALAPEHQKRIFFYTAQSAITNHWFSLLRGEKPTAQERQTAIYLGAFTPIADDLMDESGQTFEQLEQNPKTDTASHILFTYLLNKLAAQRAKSPAFAEYFTKAHLAQNASLKQLRTEQLDLTELEKITFDKGGYYTTLYRFALNHPAQRGEEAAIYTLGSILQVLNDLFDIHKDFHNGVQTLVTRKADIGFISGKLSSLESEFNHQFFALDYPPQNKKRAYRAIMAIVTRGHVALQQYKKLQGASPKLDIAAYPRKPLIVDMEKVENVWRNLKATTKATL